MQEDLTSGSADKMTSRLIVSLPFVLVAIVAGFFWAEWRNKPSRPDEVTWSMDQNRTSRIEREIMLMFPSPSGDLLTEKRVLRGFETERQEIQMCLEMFLRGPAAPDTWFPAVGRIQVAGVYLDGRNGLVLDLNTPDDPFNMGGVGAEHAFLQAVIQTIKVNYPAIEWLMFLVNGATRNTFAGHIDISDVFRIKS